MKTLHQNWITESHIDFEYKKYVLLAYLQDVERYFEEKKLYPVLSDLVMHYKNMLLIKTNKNTLSGEFPEKLKSFDLEHFNMVFEKIVQDDAMMEEIGQIIDFSIPKFEYYLAEGKKIYDFVEGKMLIYPVGIIPLYPLEGYFFLQNGAGKQTQVYEYQVTIFEKSNEKYRGIHTHYIMAYQRNFTNTMESIKMELIRNNKKLPNPAVYLIETEIMLPEDETLIPVAKRTLIKYLATTTK